MTGFHLISEGPRHFELQHPAGHRLSIAKDAITPEHMTAIRKLPRPQMMAEGGDVLPEPTPMPTPEPTQEPLPTDMTQPGPWMNTGNAPAGDTIAPDEAAAFQAFQNSMGTPQAPAQPNANGMDILNAPLPASYEDYFKKEGAAQTGLAGAQAAQQTAIAQAAQENIVRQQAAQVAHDAKLKDLDTENAQLTKDVAESKIDPGRYWEQQTGIAGAGKRLAGLLGMFLGGPAQLRTGVNPAAQAIQSTINEDIEAQKADMGKKQNLLRFNLEKYGDERQAYAATQLSLTNLAQAYLQKVTAQTQSPIIQKQAQMAGLQLEQQKIGLRMSLAKMAANQALMGGSSGATIPNQLLPFIDEKDQPLLVRTPQFPGQTQGGWTKARSPEDKKEITDALTAKQSIDSTLQKVSSLIQSNKTGEGTFFRANPWSEVSEAGKSYAQQLFEDVRKMSPGIRENPAAAKQLEAMIPRGDKIRTDKAMAQLMRFKDWADNEIASQYANRTYYNPPNMQKTLAALKR